MVPIKELNFYFSKSSGPGGQNVNKLNTRVTLVWSYRKSTLAKAILLRFEEKYSYLINEKKEVIIRSQRFRNQGRNVADCIEKLESYLKAVEKPPKKRIATKATKSSQLKRMGNKRHRGMIKNKRRKVSQEE